MLPLKFPMINAGSFILNNKFLYVLTIIGIRILDVLAQFQKISLRKFYSFRSLALLLRF